ncbi:hypothetical protein CALCODRAFT_481000 [Calocera cornea HHB12733]|uniref:DUF6535 domain-containing protein n=1 Tax=Calocera cornea HHB12733 TaxID=1353952 RepID=A0A165I4G7_9BASI|nr:hypothetical protein CALCODRAFT_481000 [Calocera cornea HHB12733]
MSDADPLPEVGESIREQQLSKQHRDWEIWPIYLKESKAQDTDLVKGWNGDMDLLLLFAGLFSAVVTSFLSQNAIGNLQVPYDQYAVAIALGQLSGSTVRLTGNCSNSEDMQYNPACFQIDWQDLMVNVFWFAALTFSLAAALLAMLAKTWIREYSSDFASIPYDRARQREYRYRGQVRWELGAVIDSLMILLHISLFLFFAGLVVFLQDLNSTLFQIVTPLVAATFAVYIIFSVLPLAFPDCPYRFPPITALRVWILNKLGKGRHRPTSVREREIYTIDQTPAVEPGAVAWLLRLTETSTEMTHVQHVALAALKHLAALEPQRRALLKEGVLETLYLLFLDCDPEKEDRIGLILSAIGALLDSKDTGASTPDGRDFRVVSKELYLAVFTKLVSLLENAKSSLTVVASTHFIEDYY